MPTITVSDVKDLAVSDEGALTTLTFATKYVGDFGITMPSASVDRLIAVLQDARGKPQPKEPPEPNQLRVSIPKTWAILTEAEQRGVVIVVFNHQADERTAYALSPEAAREMAAGLLRNAEAVLARKKASAAQDERPAQTDTIETG